MERIRGVFMGCWGIGRAVLDALHDDERFQLVGVLTHTPRPGDSWSEVVKSKAEQLNIPVTLFDGLDNAGIAERLYNYEPDVLFVHAYPRKLPRTVYEIPSLGTVNIHPSLLPLHRGPSPTLEVLAAQEKETGLTSHYMDEGYDTGPIVHQERVFVSQEDTLETIIERLKTKVRPLVHETVSRILNPAFTPVAQVGTDSNA